MRYFFVLVSNTLYRLADFFYFLGGFKSRIFSRVGGGGEEGRGDKVKTDQILKWAFFTLLSR